MELRKIRAELVDLFFPMLEERTPKQVQDEKARRDAERIAEVKLAGGLPSDEKRLSGYLESVEELVEKEQARRTSVEARLTSIIGLTSIAATVVLTALFSMAAGTLLFSQATAKLVLVSGCFYLALQLFAALFAAVEGLSRAAYVHETVVDLLPPASMVRTEFLRKCIVSKFDLLDQHKTVNNEKVSQMAVAHRAIKNFLVMLLLIAFAAAWTALDRNSKSDTSGSGTTTKCCTSPPLPARQLVQTKLASIGPFPDGEHMLVQANILSCIQEALKPYGARPVIGWQLVGRVDKRPLRPDRAAIYGSNQALAMVRAKWVADNILARLPSFDITTAVLSVGGATGIGKSVSNSELQSDRVVDVFLITDDVAQQAPSGKMSGKPSPVVCSAGEPIVSRVSGQPGG